MAEFIRTEVFRPPHPTAPIQTTPKLDPTGQPGDQQPVHTTHAPMPTPVRTRVTDARKVLFAISPPAKDEEMQFPSPLTKHKVAFCSSYSAKGTVEGVEKVSNQDSYLVCELEMLGTSGYFLMVSDGHGDSGESVSGYVTTYLPSFFLEALERNPFIPDALKAAYEQVNETMRKCDFDAVCSGATCLTIVIFEGQMYIANVGDSRAVICQNSQAVGATKDHKPSDPTERHRIEAAGGRVEPMCGPNGQSVGPPRIWFQGENTPGLTLSRAMGDFVATSIGVIASPDVTAVSLSSGNAFVILASDGIWEFVSEQEAADLVRSYGPSEQAAAALVAVARERWARAFSSVDDITAVVAFIGD